MDANQQKLIEIFRNNVKGKVPDTSSSNVKHDGKSGHWLEKQFMIPANASNTADILGYELKNETSSKTSFGDWSANEFIFDDGNRYEKTLEEYQTIYPLTIVCKTEKAQRKQKRRHAFLEIFGSPNPDKEGRYSYSGRPIPKINTWNDFGQILLIQENLDIIIQYSYSQDKRNNKEQIVPIPMQKDKIVLQRWYGQSSRSTNKKDKCLKDKLEDKFNQNGWFTCKTDSSGQYNQICFGKPIDFATWINWVKDGIVFFDCGMYQNNNRPYQQWRANNTHWNSLITDIFS